MGTSFETGTRGRPDGDVKKPTHKVDVWGTRVYLPPGNRATRPSRSISVFRKLEGGDLEDEVSELNVATRKSHRV